MELLTDLTISGATQTSS